MVSGHSPGIPMLMRSSLITEQLPHRTDFPSRGARLNVLKYHHCAGVVVVVSADAAGSAVPSAGVYTGWVSYGGVVVPAVTNIGTNPTVESGRRMRLETHTLEETPLGYGDRAQAWFGERLRGECRFASVEALQAQVLSDKETARAWGRTHRLGQLWPGAVIP